MKMHKIYPKMDLKNLSQEQKDSHKHICAHFMEWHSAELDFFGNAINCNEMWIYQCSNGAEN